MASTFTPSGSTLNGTVGSFFTTTFTYQHTVPLTFEDDTDNIGITNDVGVYLSNGATVAPGITVSAPDGNPSTGDVTITISGTPIANGTWSVYLKGTFA